MKLTKDKFGQLLDTPVTAFTLENDNGLQITCINYGCIITKIVTPDQEGHLENIVLGYDTLNEYIENNSYFGAICGRVAGRIGSASFELDGKEYTLAKNDNGNHLHGGIKGFDKVIWDAEGFETEHEVGVHFSYLSPDGEEGYPGNLNIQVTYALNNQNELAIRYKAKSDKKTLLNVTNHSYFNLSGNLKRTIAGHTLTMKSEKFLELNDELLPTGAFADVEGTPFDFSKEREIQTGIESEHPQNQLAGNGYDHPFLLAENHNQEIILKDPESGRTLTVETDEPSVVVYSGNSISPEGEIRGVPSKKHLGICLETQGLPDAIHHPLFPSVVLEEGKEYRSTTTYRFGQM